MLQNIEPQIVWKNFSKLNEIPRPSKKEEKVIAFIKAFGESLGLETIVDETGNVLIKKPATAGMEDRKKVVLQSHLDMVCQKNNDTQFDFDTEGINMKIEGDWVKAVGTTLGADNGLGVASIMSLLESNDIPHPALEALFTIDEETGMTGAFGLKPGFLSGKILLNLDTEEDDELTIGCAGGIDVTITQQYNSSSPNGQGVSISVSGLQGGHSGADIHKGHGNANILLARFLNLGIDDDIELAKIDGGGLRNAIPREATATFYVRNVVDFIEKAEQLKQAILLEFSTVEKDLQIKIEQADTKMPVATIMESRRIVNVLNALHNGVYRMSPDIEGLVEASNNVARVLLDNGSLQILNLTRSSVESTKMEVANQLKSVASLADMHTSFSGSYPGWKPNPDSSIMTVMKRIYHELFNSEATVDAIHAGLECGIIGANYPEMEMISFGPTIRGAHSPDERANIPSTQKFWNYLKTILSNIPKQ